MQKSRCQLSGNRKCCTPHREGSSPTAMHRNGPFPTPPRLAMYHKRTVKESFPRSNIYGLHHSNPNRTRADEQTRATQATCMRYWPKPFRAEQKGDIAGVIITSADIFDKLRMGVAIRGLKQHISQTVCNFKFSAVAV